MNILFIGDISGRPGRRTIKEILPQIKNENKVDFVIANAENSAGGRGVTRAIIDELTSYGIDFFTTGEHVWDIKDFKDELHDQKLPLVRPLNYERSEDLPGVGFKEIDLGSKGKIVVIALLGQTFMRDFVKNPFWEMDRILDENDWENTAIIVDFHTEATAEKITMGNYLRNRVTAVLGTHTHVGTIDARILGKTGYVTDVGMVGPNDASLWANFDNVTHNFKYPFKKPFEMEMIGSRVFNSVLLEIDDDLGKAGIRKCKKISRVDKYLE